MSLTYSLEVKILPLPSYIHLVVFNGKDATSRLTYYYIILINLYRYYEVDIPIFLIPLKGKTVIFRLP